MDELDGRVAAITGGASGIGLAMARRFAREGMKLSLADIESGPLEQAAEALRADGAEVLTSVVDVSNAEQMDGFASQTLERFGSVHIVCNNAGVMGSGVTWEQTTKDWEFVLGPNLWGVIHGVRVFTKHLVAQNEGHIVNTASMAGLISVPGLGAYNVSKHAVVTLSETLFGELAQAADRVGVSVLCPGFVNTNILDAGRFMDEPPAETDESRAQKAMVAQIMSAAMSPDTIADMVHDAVRARKFYILSHEGSQNIVAERAKRIVEGGDPIAIDGAVFMGGNK